MRRARVSGWAGGGGVCTCSIARQLRGPSPLRRLVRGRPRARTSQRGGPPTPALRRCTRSLWWPATCARWRRGRPRGSPSFVPPAGSTALGFTSSAGVFVCRPASRVLGSRRGPATGGPRAFALAGARTGLLTLPPPSSPPVRFPLSAPPLYLLCRCNHARPPAHCGWGGGEAQARAPPQAPTATRDGRGDGRRGRPSRRCHGRSGWACSWCGRQWWRRRRRRGGRCADASQARPSPQGTGDA